MEDTYVLIVLMIVFFLIVLRKLGISRSERTDPSRVGKDAKRGTAPRAPILITGKAHVIDGDSLVVAKQELRLFGIDAPEFDHPYGKSAKSALIKLCDGQIIRAELQYTDTHGRKVARCTLPDGRDLSAEMVKLGLAIDWAKFSGGIYRHLEIEGARKKLWLADARQKGRMDVWERYAQTKAKQ